MCVYYNIIISVSSTPRSSLQYKPIQLSLPAEGLGQTGSPREGSPTSRSSLSSGGSSNRASTTTGGRIRSKAPSPASSSSSRGSSRPSSNLDLTIRPT